MLYNISKVSFLCRNPFKQKIDVNSSNRKKMNADVKFENEFTSQKIFHIISRKNNGTAPLTSRKQVWSDAGADNCHFVIRNTMNEWQDQR